MNQVDLFRAFESQEARDAVVRVMTPDPETGRLFIGQGQEVDRFEQELARLLEVEDWRRVVSVNSCTAAIDLALHLCGVTPQAALRATVISTSMTCSATNGPAVTRGAQIAWADVDATTGLIDPQSVLEVGRNARAQGASVKAVVAVDWGGASCDYNALREVRDALRGVPIIQDAAHSLLATYKGRYMSKVGGDYQCYSFGPIKQLSHDVGGALVLAPWVPTEQVERARLLRWHGLDRTKGDSFRCEQDIAEVGYKYHLSDVAAAALSANLRHVPGLIHQSRMNAQCLSEWLRDVPGVTVPAWDAGCSYWLYTLLTPERDRFLAFLKERGIMASPVHAPNHRHTAMRRATHPASAVLRGTDAFAASEVAIPSGWWVSPGELHQVAEAVTEWSQRLAQKVAA